MARKENCNFHLDNETVKWMNEWIMSSNDYTKTERNLFSKQNRTLWIQLLNSKIEWMIVNVNESPGFWQWYCMVDPSTQILSKQTKISING